MTLTPASRILDAVLRDALAQPGGLRVIAGTYAASQPSDRRYANVSLGGVTVSVPNLNGGRPGAAGDRLLRARRRLAHVGPRAPRRRPERRRPGPRRPRRAHAGPADRPDRRARRRRS